MFEVVINSLFLILIDTSATSISTTPISTPTIKQQLKRKISTDSTTEQQFIITAASDSNPSIKDSSLSKTNNYNNNNNQDIGDDSCEDSSSQDARRKKKARTTFTGRQIFELEKQFEIKKYLSSSERAEMAKLLNVTETQVCCIFSFNPLIIFVNVIYYLLSVYI